MASLPELRAGNGFVGVVPNEPALFVYGILDGDVRQDFSEAIDINDAIVGQMIEANRKPSFRPFHIFRQGTMIAIVAEVFANVVRRIGNHDVKFLRAEHLGGMQKIAVMDFVHVFFSRHLSLVGALAFQSEQFGFPSFADFGIAFGFFWKKAAPSAVD